MSLPEESKTMIEMQKEINRCYAQIEKCVEGLNEIASWDEGDTVSGKFDCPAHATQARAILKELGEN